MDNSNITLTTLAKKIVIFSDTHLTKSFDQKKCDFILNIINEADLVIINGDFWDSWFCTFNEFINSRWACLFPKLLEKNTIYIHGNHDPANSCDDNVKLFSTSSCESCNITTPTTTFRVEHGHKLLVGKKPFLLEVHRNFVDGTKLTSIKKIIYKFLHGLEVMGRFLFGYKFLHENIIGKNINKRMKNSFLNIFLICGDSHFPELDIDNNYGNTGAIIYGFASYIVIENGSPKLQKTIYGKKI